MHGCVCRGRFGLGEQGRDNNNFSAFVTDRITQSHNFFFFLLKATPSVFSVISRITASITYFQVSVSVGITARVSFTSA